MFFTISKSDRRSFRQINSGKINLLKKVAPVGVELATATITHLKSDAETVFTKPLHFWYLGNFWNQWSVIVIHLKDLPFNTCLDGHIG